MCGTNTPDQEVKLHSHFVPFETM